MSRKQNPKKKSTIEKSNVQKTKANKVIQMTHKLFYITGSFFFLLAIACNNNDPHANHRQEVTKDMYTCPMPQDSVFSDKPGIVRNVEWNCEDGTTATQQDHDHEMQQVNIPVPCIR
jgi:Cu(I)/Ag(I) efflux system membrane fusion protein